MAVTEELQDITVRLCLEQASVQPNPSRREHGEGDSIDQHSDCTDVLETGTAWFWRHALHGFGGTH